MERRFRSTPHQRPQPCLTRDLYLTRSPPFLSCSLTLSFSAIFLRLFLSLPPGRLMKTEYVYYVAPATGQRVYRFLFSLASTCYAGFIGHSEAPRLIGNYSRRRGVSRESYGWYNSQTRTNLRVFFSLLFYDYGSGLFLSFLLPFFLLLSYGLRVFESRRGCCFLATFVVPRFMQFAQFYTFCS